MKKYVLASLLFTASSTVVAEQISWEQLRPAITPIEDPFLALSDEQLFELGTLAKYRQSKALNESQLQTKKEIEAKLHEEGVNVDWLFSKRQEITDYRRQIATQPNTDLTADSYEIPGFITPVEFNDDVVTKFFLVPTSGACVHTPPPPANQIVLVSYPKGLKLTSLYEPVWVKGELEIEKVKADVTYVDGAMDVETVYQMDADSIRAYQ
ncbi:DUF3299 domain-containing protein [Vibrio alfacsensis]|uniref:DUF3299 domain-containing protein n=1 Tax=Vibrio alfacsensis TaxID=1074311 RepID=A0ABN5PIT3_9VIBR|nr:DUF3299 domain-containing protein [Vibrio alfacsensis]AXY03035.1 DUF3299 domain-containing protein [Vibrio alfacsensis]